MSAYRLYPRTRRQCRGGKPTPVSTHSRKRCFNDATYTYKGSEPSPKGRGYCAHAEQVGTQMKGRDGRTWIVKQYAKGLKRWIPLRTTSKRANVSPSTRTKPSSPSACKHFVYLKRKQPKYRLQNELIGRLVDGRTFYEWQRYNTFADKPRMLTRPFLDKFERMPMSPAQLRTYCGDKTLVRDASLNTSLHKGYTNKRFIQHNGDWLCMVRVKQKTAYVYTIKHRADLAIEDDQYENEGLYTHRLLTCPCTRMFDADDTSDQYQSGYNSNAILALIHQYKQYKKTGNDKQLRSIKERLMKLFEDRECSPAFPYAPGHTVLLQNKPHQYTYIGKEIYQFDTDDIIQTYYCVEFSSFVPYPVAIGTEYAYFLLDHTRVPMKYMHNIDSSKWYKAYEHYLDPDDSASASLRTHAKPMKRVKRLHRFDI